MIRSARTAGSQPVRLHLVRHGRAAAGWDSAADPGLDEAGRAEARAVADVLAAALGPRSIVSSPLARARETAEPLAARWGVEVGIAPAFGEIPSPTGDLAGRGAWLRSALVGRWDDLDSAVQRWRLELVDAALALRSDTVVFTHFVAINALVGWALGHPLVTTFAPANASVTELEIAAPGAAAGPRLTVVRRGSEAPPQVG